MFGKAITVIALAIACLFLPVPAASADDSPISNCEVEIAFGGLEALNCTIVGSTWFMMSGTAPGAPGYRLQWGVGSQTGQVYVNPGSTTVGSAFQLPAVSAASMADSKAAKSIKSIMGTPTTWTLHLLAIPPAGIPGATINIVVYIQSSQGLDKIVIPASAVHPVNPQAPQTPVQVFI